MYFVASSLVFFLPFQFSHNYVRHLIYRKQRFSSFRRLFLHANFWARTHPRWMPFFAGAEELSLSPPFASAILWVRQGSVERRTSRTRRTRLLMWENVTIPAPPAKSCQSFSRNCSFCLSARPIQGLCSAGVECPALGGSIKPCKLYKNFDLWKLRFY